MSGHLPEPSPDLEHAADALLLALPRNERGGVLTERQIRYRQRRESLLTEHPADPSERPDEQLLQLAEVNHLLATCGITREERAVYLLSTMFSLGDDALALVFGYSRPTIITRRRTAHRKLRQVHTSAE